MVSKIEKEVWKDTGIDTIQVSSKCRFRDVYMLYGKRRYWYFEPRLTRKPSGYVRVYLDKTYTLHLLIADLFIPNPNNLPQVNHKDGNKENNNASNLERVTIQQNCLHSHYELGNESSKPKRPVNVYKEGRLVFNARSVNEAARYVGGHTTCISKVCNGSLPEYKAHSFQYA